jgi:prepilin-type N-terminal cleavage/methylation domain-containing protein
MGTRDERGFSLVELMMVVRIIGILIGMFLPTFSVARQRLRIVRPGRTLARVWLRP